MNPYYDEQRLREEVIFLHSLWHQGPPDPQPFSFSKPQTQNLNPISSSSFFQPHYNNNPHHHHQHHRTLTPFAPSHTRSLPPIAPTTIFKKPNNKRKESEPKTNPGSEWSCSDLPDQPGTTTTSWPPLKKPCSAPPPILLPEEKEKLSALQAQNKACRAFREILRNFHDDDEEDDDDFGEEEDDGDGEDLEEFEEFFIGLFMEDNELRRYYQKHFENGGFCCLVCDAIGKKKSGKKFKDCIGLVQHSMSILRTTKKLAHRAFGQAVCKVLGWDIDRLPTIVMKGKPLGMEQAQAEGEPKENNKAVSLEHCDEPVKERALVVDQSIDEGEPMENVDDDGEDGTKKADNKVASLELGDEPVEESAVGVYQSTIEGEPKENVDDDGKDGTKKSDNKVASLELGDEPVEESTVGVDQSTSEEGDINNNADNLDQVLDIGLKNGVGGAIDIEEQASVAVLHMQRKALEACQEYFDGNGGSNSDDDNNDDDEDGDELIDEYDSEECEEFKFFL